MSKPRMGAPKRVAVGLLAGSLALFGVALAPSAGAVDDVTSERLAGATRYGTAAAVAADEAFASPTMAIVASGENSHLADALAASTLAGANAPAPIVLTQTDTYTAEAKSALAALKGKGVTKVSIVGGTAAVATTVENAIKADGFTVTRVAGVDRFATAGAVEAAARAANAPDPIAGKKTAFIASGFSFADALAGSPAAAQGGLPMLLTNVDSLPQATKDALDAGDIGQAIILGGTVPVSDAVANELKTLTGSDPIRLAGQNRFGTAAAIADYEIATLGFASTSVIVANGLTLVDALTAGPLGGILEAPIMLTASCPAETTAWLDAHSDLIAKLYIIGGTAAVDAATATCAETAAESTDNDPAVAGKSQTAVLNGPELQSVSISDIEIDDWEGGFGTGLEIEYTFTFDTEVDDSVEDTSFKLYGTDSALTAEGFDADASGSEVAVWFELGGGAITPSATLAAVENGAVEDEDGNPNPPQSVSINPLSTGPSTVLTDIEMTDEEDGIATFTFKGTTYPEALDLGILTFTLIDEDGVEYSVVSSSSDVETAPDADDPSNTVEVTFDDLADDGLPATSDLDDVVRGYITQNLSGGIVQNIDVKSGGDVQGPLPASSFPDLESIDLPADNGDLGDDEVLFAFDEEIDSADAVDFHLYYGIDGSGIADGTAATIDGNEVTVTFTEEQLNDFVAGGWVGEDAVTSNGNDIDNQGDVGDPNLADGDVFDYNAEKAGVVLGPQLDGVELITETDSFGDFEEFQVVFTFTRDLADDTGIAGFSVWINDEDDVEEVELGDCDTDNDNQVVCIDDDEDSEIADALVASVEAGAVETDADDNIDVGDSEQDFPNPEGSFEIEEEATA